VQQQECGAYTDFSGLPMSLSTMLLSNDNSIATEDITDKQKDINWHKLWLKWDVTIVRDEPRD